LAFLIGCAVFLMAGASGVQAETSNKEEARCEGTSTTKNPIVGTGGPYSTNDLPGCPKGGLLLGTDDPDELAGKDGDDEIRGLGAKDDIYGGPGSDRLADWPLAGWWGGGECGGAIPFEQKICREVSAKAGVMTCYTEAPGTTIWGQRRERMVNVSKVVGWVCLLLRERPW
jgi:hypothetical protein